MTIAAPVIGGALDAPIARLAWRPVALGILWGIAVSAMEAVTLPVMDGDWGQVWHFALWIVPGWSAVGIVLAIAVELFGPRIVRPALVAAGALGCALALSAIWSMMYGGIATHGTVPTAPAIFPHGVDPLAAFAYQMWTVLFYGGLYVVAWRLNYRAERTRALLGGAELARVRAETLLGEAQLQSLRGRVEPALLLRVMTEVERRYARTGASADRLLALLVAFLRHAMPAVRSGRSTLRGELALARAWGELQGELEPGTTRWAITGDAPDDVPFPPLLLLPLLDAHAAASGSPLAGQLVVAVESDDIVVRLHGAPPRRADWIPAELGYRIRVGISALYGAAWSMTSGNPADATSPALALTLRPTKE